MAEFQPGDVVVLKSGSMRMLVESVDGESIGVLWANDGGIGRDTLPAFALKEWEDRGPREHGGHGGGGKPFGGPRAGGGKPFTPRGDSKPFPAKGGHGGSGGPGGPRPKTGMDGKPKQKTFYRKDG